MLLFRGQKTLSFFTLGSSTYQDMIHLIVVWVLTPLSLHEPGAKSTQIVFPLNLSKLNNKISKSTRFLHAQILAYE